MSRRIEVEINADKVAAQLEDFARKQIPFASALALTELAAMSAKENKNELQRQFELRNKYSQKGIQINRANKKDWPDLYSEVGIDERRSYLVDHVVGAKRKGKSKGGRAVLKNNFAKEARGKKGRVKPSKKPGKIIDKSKPRTGKKRKRPSYKTPSKPFVISSAGYMKGKRSPNDLVVRRTEKDRRGELEVLYAFEVGVDIKREFELDTVTARTVAKHYKKVFGKSLAKAIATANR